MGDKKVFSLEEELVASREVEAFKTAEILGLREELKQLSSDIAAYKEQIEDGSM